MFGDETNTYKQFVVVCTQCSTLHEIRTALSFVFTATIIIIILIQFKQAVKKYLVLLMRAMH